MTWQKPHIEWSTHLQFWDLPEDLKKITDYDDVDDDVDDDYDDGGDCDGDGDDNGDDFDGDDDGFTELLHQPAHI